MMSLPLVLRRLLGVFATMLTLAAVMPSGSLAQHLSAIESDPKVLGWMEGFPPPPDKQIAQPDSNYFSFPKLRWTVCHLREFLPTEQQLLDGLLTDFVCSVGELRRPFAIDTGSSMTTAPRSMANSGIR